MKYVVVLGDGMADYKIDELGGKTPLEKANKPTIDALAKVSEQGLCATVPQGMKPGSDTANLGVLGYNAKECYTGRSPLEAVSIGVDMKSTDVCFRMNFVTISEDEVYEDKVMLDHSSGEITTEEAKVLLDVIKQNFEDYELSFYLGVSYRHAMIYDNGSMDVTLEPPHNFLGKSIGDYFPKGVNSEKLFNITKKSYDLLNEHEINIDRQRRGLNKANSIWIWGEGTKPKLQNFKELYGVKGAMISAVDLLKGIAISTGMTSIDVEGANASLHTNYAGKVAACLDALQNGHDLVYVHIEAPDECGHRGEALNKVKAIEYLDEKVVKPIFDTLTARGERFKMLIMPDHPTPVVLRTHTSDPVPYIIYDSGVKVDGKEIYSEEAAKSTGVFIERGYEIMRRFLDFDVENIC